MNQPPYFIKGLKSIFAEVAVIFELVANRRIHVLKCKFPIQGVLNGFHLTNLVVVLGVINKLQNCFHSESPLYDLGIYITPNWQNVNRMLFDK